MRRRRGVRTAVISAVASSAIAASLLQAPSIWAAGGGGVPAASAAAADGKPSPASVFGPQRGEVLGKGWEKSTDRAWTTSSDANGFHLLVAEKKSGYAWRTAATLKEPGFDTDAWIGNACVTASGRRALVVYAPRTFTNRAELMARGGFTAAVDLESGKVSKLPLQASLSYYNPGCGTGEDAVLTQSGGEDKAATRLVRVDAATGRLSRPVEVRGQLTSAVPVEGGIAAAAAGRVVRIDGRGKVTPLARTSWVPYGLTSDAEGGLVFLDKTGKDSATAERLTPERMKKPVGDKPAMALAEGQLTKIGVTRSAQGRVFLMGDTKQTAASLPGVVERTPGAPQDAMVSTRGEALVTHTEWADGKDSGVRRAEPEAARPVNISLSVRATGKTPSFTVDPAQIPAQAARKGGELSPALSFKGAPGARKSLKDRSDDPVESEDERFCSVPRNDVRNQAMQPKPRQVEWAVDKVVQGSLGDLVHRPENWKNLGMPAYSPSDYFSPRNAQLEGGGRVPAQVLLGVAMQESNMWQAGREAVPGVTGNPLIGNFYGISYAANGQQTDPWAINWEKADCGYGITQATDGMRLASRPTSDTSNVPALPYQVQRAVALDYTVNIAYGHQILVSKWNQTRAAGLTVNNEDAARPENWFFALWAYNSGLHPENEKDRNGGQWGVGWRNNPANPEWKSGRAPFLARSAHDAAHPQDWPYQEKVLGFAAYSFEALESPGKTVAAFRPAWWTSNAHKESVKPPATLFCTMDDNSCDPGRADQDGKNDENGPCRITSGQYKLYCWWHKHVVWKDCRSACGNELIRFTENYPNEEPDGTAYQPNCSTSESSSGNSAPPYALIIDDTADDVPSVRPDCARPSVNAGTFGFKFSGDSGRYQSKMDLHQIGAGYGGHFYYGHTRAPGDNSGKLAFEGTWKLNNDRNGWTRVVTHLPDHGAWTQQAKYTIDLGDGTKRVRYINQNRRANNWVSLGVYNLKGRASVTLTTEAADGTGDADIAFDAVGFQPLPGKPRHIVAALGDSYSSGEGAGDYITESDSDHGGAKWNACRRSKNAWPRKMVLPGNSMPTGQLSDMWADETELGFVACSGARTWNVSGWNNDGVQVHPDSWEQPSNYSLGEGQFHEMTQVESGVLDENTTLVTLTIGGNDGNAFTDAVVNCYIVGVCKKEDYTDRVDRAQSAADDLIRRISAKAPNAQIVLMGYPRLHSSKACDTANSDALNSLADYVAEKQAATVASLKGQGIKVEFANAIAGFTGHGICDDSEWINKIVVGPNGDGDFHKGDHVQEICVPVAGLCNSRESFHPKKDGTTGYADVMNRRLAEIGYHGSS